MDPTRTTQLLLEFPRIRLLPIIILYRMWDIIIANSAIQLLFQQQDY